MGYLDGSSVTVDAVLTKKGREILADPAKGNLNITSFTCSDTGVDYTLWNPDHPSGSAFYGEAIENLPMLEASVHSEYSLSNRLVTLHQNTISLPSLNLSGLDGKGKNTLTFEDTDTAGVKVTATINGYQPLAGGTGGRGLYFVILDPSIVSAGSGARMNKTLSGTTRVFLREQDIPNAVEYHVDGSGKDFIFDLIPDTNLKQAGRKTIVYCVHILTGAYTSFTVTNNITQLVRETNPQPRG
tara:strand:+ start:574 stop:1299 length:726 start_codon:yes stop_codon:yes gene_type:complete